MKHNQTSKSSSRSRKPSWPKVLPRKPAGFKIDVLVPDPNGKDGKKSKRIYESFPTEPDAIKRAWELWDDKQKHGKAGLALEMDKRIEAADCYKLLTDYPDVTLRATVEHYIKTVLAFRAAPTVAEIVEKMIAEASANGRREKTVADLKSRLGHFGKTFGARQPSTITLPELRAWLEDPTIGARSKISRATKISQLFNYAVREGWANENLVEKITRPSVEDKAVDFYSPDEAKVLLHHAADVGLLPFVAIGLFAGIRTGEIQRLQWPAVKLAARCIKIGPEVAKKRSQRVVEINDALAAWLALCARPTGRVCDFSEDQLMFHVRQLVKAAGVTWKKNGLRHTFASYHLAQHGDPVKTAFQMGNSPVVIHNHYKGLDENGDHAKFWALRPAADAGNKIVTMPKQANG